MMDNKQVAVRVHDLENATTFKEIFDVYIDALSAPEYDDEGYLNLGYEKNLAKDSLDTLATFLDNSPLSVGQWGEMDREKHGVKGIDEEEISLSELERIRKNNHGK